MRFRKFLSAFLAAIMVASFAVTLVACGVKPIFRKDTIVVSYDPFNEKFSPFFGTTAYDMDVAGMTQFGLLTLDRAGHPVKDGIAGYEDEDGFTYNSPGKVVVTQTGSGNSLRTKYTVTMKDDLKFSDGVAVTIDDYIFSMYVLLDPTYDGPSSFNSLPILGSKAYQNDIENEALIPVLDALLETRGEKPEDFTGLEFTEAEFDAYWADGVLEEAWRLLVEGINKYVYEVYRNATGVQTQHPELFPATLTKLDGTTDSAKGYRWALAMAVWGFGEFDGDAFETYGLEKEFNMTTQFPGADDYIDELKEEYGDPLLTDAEIFFEAYDTEDAGSGDVEKLLIKSFLEFKGENPDAVVPDVVGIVRTGNYSVEITMAGFDATAILELGISVSPKHYYGENTKYNYAGKKFGFDKGNLEHVRSKTTAPMGGGPYKFVEYKNSVVYFEANANYWEGEPVTKYVEFHTVTTEQDKLDGLKSYKFDVSNPSFNKDISSAIKKYNGGGALQGSKLHTELVDNLGYGYIGISAFNVKVGTSTDPAVGAGSEASKNLRRAFATVFAVVRETVVDSYYGDAGSVINYPISNTSWAAPQPGDAGYEVAYSKDKAGEPIYAAGDSQTQKEDKAQKAAYDFLIEAGYTGNGTKVTAAPTGAKLGYTVMIPGGGVADHPAFGILTRARTILDKIGITLTINDLSNSSVLWNSLDAGTQEMWCAAWGASADPDMRQIYHSTNVINKGAHGGAKNSTGSNHYGLRDPALDKLIMDARATDDVEIRKPIYKSALDKVLEWAVEIPTYQRKNCFVFATKVVDITSIVPSMTPFYEWMSGINTFVKLSAA